MEEKGKSGAIRLTNKTAIALRRNAGKVRRAWLAFGAVLTVALAALAVYLGMRPPGGRAHYRGGDGAGGCSHRPACQKLLSEADWAGDLHRGGRTGDARAQERRRAPETGCPRPDGHEAGCTQRRNAPHGREGAKRRAWRGRKAPPPFSRRRQAGLTVVKGEQVP